MTCLQECFDKTWCTKDCLRDGTCQEECNTLECGLDMRDYGNCNFLNRYCDETECSPGYSVYATPSVKEKIVRLLMAVT
jgi:hypothetical protein